MQKAVLYTHHVTPIFTKLNLLGLLHIAYSSRYGIPVGIEPLGGYDYAVNILTVGEERLKSDLAEVMKTQGAELKMRINKVPYSHGRSGALRTIISALNEARRGEIEKFVDGLLRPRHHDVRLRGSGSPSLLLAPDLGKFSSSSIPYEYKYPDLCDVTVNGREYSICTATAAVGFENCSFKMGVESEGDIVKYLCAFASARGGVSASVTRALYWIGRRLSWLTHSIERVPEQRGLSTVGLLALLSPIVKDAARSADALSQLELNIYSLEREPMRPWMYCRDVVVVSLERVARLPDLLAGAMLAQAHSLRGLVENAPEFFNLLGEFLLSGDDTLYIEALRVLASLIHEPEHKVPGWVKSVAGFVLEHGSR